MAENTNYIKRGKMEILYLTPRGNVDVDRNYGVNTVEYESGARQYQRKWITPRVTYTFNTENTKAQKDYLENFAELRFGNFEPFWWRYEGRWRVVRFAESSVKFTEIRGYEGLGTVGYKAQISLVECKSGEYDAELEPASGVVKRYYDVTGVIPVINKNKVTVIGKMRKNTVNLRIYAQYNVADYQNITAFPQSNVEELNGAIAEADASYAFNSCYKLENVDFLSAVIMSDVTNANHMFADCRKLTTIPLIDTSNVTDAGAMFYQCSGLTTIPLIDTSNVTGAGSMFYGCFNLTTIPQLDISNATNTSLMFMHCEKLTSIPQLNTSKTTSTRQMFYGCKGLPAVFPWIIDCSSITDASNMKDMFAATFVTSVTLSNVNASIKADITSQLLKGNNTLSITFV